MQRSIFQFVAVTTAFGLVFAHCDSASGQIPPASAPVLASRIAPAKNEGKLAVGSADFKNRAPIPDAFTQNGANRSPALSWSRGPAGTQSYVVLVEDSGVERPFPIDHWALYNIPANVTNLPQGVPAIARPEYPAGAVNGLNIAKRAGYIGPKPPPGKTHPYHFEVFALDTKLALDPATTDRTAVANAMRDHVLAEGEIVGMYTGK